MNLWIVSRQRDLGLRGRWFRGGYEEVENRNRSPPSPTLVPCSSVHLICSIPEMKKGGGKVSGKLQVLPQGKVLYLLDGVHHILDACFGLRLKKVNNGLKEVVNGESSLRSKVVRRQAFRISHAREQFPNLCTRIRKSV